jgi:phosphatidylinositol-binding clathrin assembly protein
MSKPDAERALKIYRSFVKQTDLVVRYLSIARHYEHATRLEIPKIKHAPITLAKSLEDYLSLPDFEVNRRQYLAEKEAKKGGKGGASIAPVSKLTESNGSASQSTPVQARPAPKGPAPDLMDFFESIEQNQQPMAQATYQQGQPAPQGAATYNPFLSQPTGMPIQHQMVTGAMPNTNPFLQMPQQQLPQQQLPQQQSQLQQNFGGGQFSGFQPQPQQQQPLRFTPTLQSVPQSAAASFQSPLQQQYPPGTTNGSSVQSTNPFRQSMLASSTTGTSMSSFSSSNMSPFSSQPTGTNPFARPISVLSSGQSSISSPFNQPSSNTPFSPVAQSPMQTNPIAPQPTGSTNPFAKPAVSQAPNTFAPAPMVANPTGSTNPFRQSAFVNQSTGTGWQNSTQGTIGGMSSNQVDTVPVFPRPGMS